MMDVADAAVLRGVLTALLGAGWVIVATCNRTPDQLGESVLHKEHPQVSTYKDRWIDRGMDTYIVT